MWCSCISAVSAEWQRQSMPSQLCHRTGPVLRYAVTAKYSKEQSWTVTVPWLPSIYSPRFLLGAGDEGFCFHTNSYWSEWWWNLFGTWNHTCLWKKLRAASRTESDVYGNRKLTCECEISQVSRSCRQLGLKSCHWHSNRPHISNGVHPRVGITWSKCDSVWHFD